MPAGIHEVFRGSKFFSNAGVGEINKNVNIELQNNDEKITIVRTKTLFFPQFLRQAQMLILEILLCIPAVKIFAFLELEKKSWFSFGH